MKRFLLAVMFLSAVAVPLYALDQNVMIDDAMSRVDKSAMKIQNAKVISMVPFEYGKGVTVKNVEDKLVLKLAKTGKFKIMDKKSLEAVINEQKLSLSGLTEQSNLTKIGELLNADAVLFGKVELSGETIVVSVKMVDVATGAVIWADEFTGEDLNKVSFGPGLRSGFFNGSVSYLLNNNAASFATVDGGTVENQFFFAFMFTFEQRMQSLKAVSFSLDGIFYRGYMQMDPVDSNVTIGADSYRFRATANYTDLKLHLVALVRLHPGYMFDWGNDFLVFYFGPGLDANYVLADATYRLQQTSGGSYDSKDIGYTKTIGDILAFGGMTFRAGVELRFTKDFSLFMEAFYIPPFTANMIGVDTRILPKVTVGQGNSYYGMGIKYMIF